MELHSSYIVSFKIRGLQSLLVLLLSLPNAFAASASSQGINFSLRAFDGNSIKFQGDAAVSSDFIQLTKANQDQNLNASGGWATYREPMRLWDKATGNVADFTTHFTFVINSLGKPIFADGLAFFLVPEGSQLPINSFGGGLALVDPARDPSNASTWFVAIEFDTFYNINNSTIVVDPNCSQGAHVGIDLNNLNSTVYRCVDWFKDKIMSGGRINATITYNSSTQNLSVLMIDADATGTNINSSAIYDIVDLTKYLPEWVTFGFSAATGVYFELHTIRAWELSSNVQVMAGKRSNLRLLSILILLILVPAFIWLRHCSREKEDYPAIEQDDPAIDEEFEQVSVPKKFSYKDLVAATNNFATERLLGEGSFGRVYKGHLTSPNVDVAIKKIKPGASQGIKEFTTEVKTISLLRHKNLVQLIGWCHQKKELLLIYKFMSNGSLDSHLFKQGTFLRWENRYKIVQGIASALFYLHEECEQCVVHRDIKSSNIMLDDNFNAKVGDFGLARLVDHAKELPTTVLAGTRGYLAPEYIYNGKASKESDVYSFGVVLLEIACGRNVLEPRAGEGRAWLVGWVWELYGAGRLLDAADSKLGTDFDEQQLGCLMVVGLWCAHPDHTARPSIQEALNVLNFTAPPPTLPPKLPVLGHQPPLSAFATSSFFSSRAASTSGIEMSTFTTASVQSSHSASSPLLPNAG
ncbi:L-type lectin-domain containing receptor kinase IX.1-like [Rhodamnia argentea]|uniref:L-type lectin-domain containing receptor kinase IX.1-like n=1 Tax=Rhodamnia argentea TaxID=178133 RepID=A0ABM3HVY2_9MYRT|nr:L-type lectin-domain containing receptor kinase IX.1-like [Rhodamnia argentea]